MTERANLQRLERLRQSLSRALCDLSVRIEPFRDGVDCWVDLLHRRSGDIHIVRSAKVEQRITRYEGVVDFGDILEREVVASRLLREASLPTPAIRAWSRSVNLEQEPSWMLLDYIDHAPVDELSEPSQKALGQLTRRIHSIHPTGHDLKRLAPPGRWEAFMIERIIARIDAARRYIQLPPSNRIRPALQTALADRARHARSLLHLDLRPPNLAIKPDSGEIIALFDLGNVMVGDPYLEIGRLRGCGMFTPAFVKGYDSTSNVFERHHDALNAYELDLTALLVVVSREETTDMVLHELMVNRTRTLIDQIVDAGAIRG